MARKKRKKGLSPTFKAGLICIFVILLIWAVMTSKGEWYTKEVDEESDISVATIENNEEEVLGETTEEVIEETIEEVKEEIKEEVEEPEVEVVKPLDKDQIMADTFEADIDPESFTNESVNWSFRRNTDHTPVIGYNEGIDLDYFDAHYIVPTEDKVIYLTFDEGYENGYTASILDTLKANNVQATFFLTEPYIRNNKELIIRMKEEGHIVGNHSVTHPRLSEKSYAEVVEEIEGTEKALEEETGYKMDLFFRPPEGNFSERVLYTIRQQGYKTIFWSMAYVDWKVDDQPGKQGAYDHVIANYHPGAIILLHAVSESNAAALDDIINKLLTEGYRFGSLYEIESLYQ